MHLPALSLHYYPLRAGMCLCQPSTSDSHLWGKGTQELFRARCNVIETVPIKTQYFKSVFKLCRG